MQLNGVAQDQDRLSHYREHQYLVLSRDHLLWVSPLLVRLQEGQCLEEGLHLEEEPVLEGQHK